MLWEWVFKFCLGFGRQCFRLTKFAKKNNDENIESRSKGSEKKVLVISMYTVFRGRYFSFMRVIE